MTKSLLGILYLWTVSLSAMNSTAAAQAGIRCPLRPFRCSQCALLNTTGVPAAPLAATGCPSFLLTIFCWQPSRCAPATGPSETRCNSRVFASSPISLAHGNIYIEETRVKISGLSGGLMLTRQRNRIWPSTITAYQTGLFEPEGRSTDEQVFLGGDNHVNYARDGGSLWSFAFNNALHVSVPPANASVQLIPGSSYWTFAFQNGEQRPFDAESESIAYA
jgi:hypothetical protein